MDNMTYEVAKYIQDLKKFIESDDESKKYFEVSRNEDFFYKIVEAIAHENFIEHGYPELSQEQFEDVKRKTIASLSYNIDTEGVFLFLGDYGYVSLN